jgi:hypothetical protein
VNDLNPADPVEGMLIAQMVAANEATLAAYQKAWSQPPEYFEARLKYLNVADKASRTAALLSERIDRHRNQGQQQITVKHVTVNADAATNWLDIPLHPTALQWLWYDGFNGVGTYLILIFSVSSE